MIIQMQIHKWNYPSWADNTTSKKHLIKFPITGMKNFILSCWLGQGGQRDSSKNREYFCCPWLLPEIDSKSLLMMNTLWRLYTTPRVFELNFTWKPPWWGLSFIILEALSAMLASKWGMQPIVLHSCNAYKWQWWPSGHNERKGAMVALIYCLKRTVL